MKKTLPTIVISLLSAFVGVFIYTQISPKVETRVIEREVIHSRFVNTEKGKVASDFVLPSKIARPAVVYIKSKKLTSEENNTEDYDISNGSGVIVGHDGYIITNNHVIEGASSIEVVLDDNRGFIASLVGSDLMTDLALLKIEAVDLPVLEFGDSDNLKVGEWVLAIGNPFKLQSTITAGIVSAKARNINLLVKRGVESFIQTDAAVNPGNSGGALVDIDAKLVGVNTAILSKKGNYEGFSFAIPSNLVKKFISDIKTYGAMQRAWMGISITDVDSELAKYYNMDKPKGVHIDIVHRNGAAYDAGLKSKDIILSVDKTETNSDSQLNEKLAQYHPGDIIDVKIISNGIDKKVKVQLKNHVNSTEFVAIRKDKVLVDLGFELRELDKYEKDKLGSEGIKVISIYNNSTIGKCNMEVGYVIQSINDKKIRKVNDIIEILEKETNITFKGKYENYPGIYPYSITID